MGQGVTVSDGHAMGPRKKLICDGHVIIPHQIEMLYPLAYNTGIFMLIALSYMMVGTKALFDQVSCSSPRGKVLSDHVESETESESGASSVTPIESLAEEEDLSGNKLTETEKITSLIERDNVSLREANQAWYERAEALEKEKREIMNERLEVVHNCMASLLIVSMMFTVYGAVIYTHLLRKMTA